MVSKRRCCSALPLVLAVVTVAVATAESVNPMDCMQQYIELSRIPRASSARIHAALKKNRIDQSVFRSASGYTDLRDYLSEVGLAHPTDRYNLYLCLKKGDSDRSHLRCSTQPPCGKGTCILSANKGAYQCKCPLGYGGDRCKEDLPTRKLEKRLDTLEEQFGRASAFYTRWGRDDCPGTADLVYHGYTAGSHHAETGNGANRLCLPTEPVYGRHADVRWGSALYPAAYVPQHDYVPYPRSIERRKLLCAVCTARGKFASIMIPATNVCPASWQREYHGFLLSSHHTEKKTEYSCFDDHPEVEGGAVPYQHNLYRVATNVGFPSKYITARELTCVVCTK